VHSTLEETVHGGWAKKRPQFYLLQVETWQWLEISQTGYNNSKAKALGDTQQ